MRPSSIRNWLLILGFCALFGLLNFSTMYSEDLLEGHVSRPSYYLVNELSAALCFFILLPVLLPVIRKMPFTKDTWYRVLPLHFLASIATAAAHTTLMTLTRTWLYPLFGFGTYETGPLLLRYGMEYQKQVLVYFGIVLFLQMLRANQQRQESEERRRGTELRAARLQTALAETKLTTLRGQLQPHFLFNTLNMISSIMYEDVEAADRMISRLSQLLRISLDRASEQKIRLADEFAIVEGYLEIMQCRFQDRIEYELHSSDELLKALVPSFILQPLVENAIKHGPSGIEEESKLKVEVFAASTEGELRLLVADNGSGSNNGSAPGGGIGLKNTRERIEQLYGQAGKLVINSERGRGFRVEISFPLEWPGSDRPIDQDF